MFNVRGSALSAQLHSFAHGTSGLDEHQLLYVELRAYSLSPVVCRRIESAHSEWKNVAKKVTTGRFAWRAAAMRRNDICKDSFDL